MMKNLITYLIMILSCVSVAQAQDILVTKNGDALKVYGVEVGSETVFYQEQQETDAPTKRIAKKDLLIIRYANGHVVNMTDSNSSESSDAASALSPVNNPAPQSAAAIAANKELIAKYNSNPAHFIGEKISKSSKVLYCECFMTEDSRICDDHVELIYKTDNISLVNNKLSVTVKNKSEQTIYIDLGDSFFTSEQVAESYYVPQITNSTSTKSTGVGINAGAVTGALGIGGALGTLASGVNVGGGTTHGTSTSVFSQRVVAIPPKSTIELSPKFFINREKKFDNGVFFEITPNFNCINLYLPKANLFTVGSEKILDTNNSILHFSHFLTYAFDEAITTPCKLTASFFVNRVIGVKAQSVIDYGGAYWGIDDHQLSDNYKQKLRILVRQHQTN